MTPIVIAGRETATGIDIKVTEDGAHDKFRHYFEKTDIDANLMHGTPMTALCGKVVHQQADPKGKTVCHTCQEVYDNIVGMNLPGRDGRDS